MENKNCQNCKKNFAIGPEDFNFYEKMKVPAPTFCPECRLVRRLIMRNERALYKRKCDLCGQNKIMVYPDDSPFTVYCFTCWWNDKWDSEQFGKEYDFSKTFFEQYNEVYKSVPRLGIIQQGFMSNSEYTNRVSDLKDCYLIFASADNENCHYGSNFWNSKDSMDCYNIRKSEKCYECLDCYNCSDLKYSRECNSCVDSYFMLNCRNCISCFGCVNLRNKNYCIFNEQYTKEDYQQKIKEMNLIERSSINKIQNKVAEMFLEYIVPYMVTHHSINVSGNWTENSKDTLKSFNCDNVENGKYLFGISDAKDVMDYTYWGKSSELIYETASVGRQCSSVLFSNESWDQLIRAEHCTNCMSSSDLFGCVGLRKKQYCILNKQYSKDEYSTMVEKIKKHMIDMPYIDKLGRKISYGEFLPCDLTPFAYNESIAQEYMPKTKEQAVSEGYKWRKPDLKDYKPTIYAKDLPNTINNVDDAILKEIISCEHDTKCNQQCTKAFKITSAELSFYRVHKIPLPVLCPNCRHYNRLEKGSL